MRRAWILAVGLLIQCGAAPSGRSQDCMQWVRRDDVGGPGPQTRHVMTYDPDRQRVILLTSDTAADLWEYDGRQWVRVFVVGARPSARLDAAMVYDVLRQELVLVGGFGRQENDYLADTWTCRITTDATGNSVGVWRRRPDVPDYWRVSSSDSDEVFGESGARAEHSLIYDRRLGGTRLFGGKARIVRDARLHNTFNRENYSLGSALWDGNQWVDRRWQRTRFFPANDPGQPPVGGEIWMRAELGRKRVAVAYDEARLRVVVFGGLRQIYQQRHYETATQTKTDDESYIESIPSLQWMDQFDQVFPSPWDNMLDRGGGGRCGQADLSRIFGAQMVYDSRRDRYVTFGGAYVTGEPDRAVRCAPFERVDRSDYLSEMLPNRDAFREWSPSDDTNPAPDVDQLHDISAGDKGSPMPPANRIDHTMAFDSHRGVTVVYGGWDGTGGSFNTLAHETWEYGPGLLDFVEQPEPLSELCLGGTLVLSITPLALAPPFFQWHKDGRPLANATNRVLTVPNLGIADAGSYHCELRDRCGNRRTSRQAVVRVGGPPTIVLQPSNISVCPGDDAQTTFFFDSDFPATVEWYRLGVSSMGEVFLSDLDRVPGADSNTLFIRSMQPEQSGIYRARITNRCGTLWTLPITVTAGIWLRGVPADSTNEVCATLRLVTLAAGKAPLRYQWRRNGEPMVNSERVFGVTNAPLEFRPLRYLDDAVYDCVVSNDCHVVTTRLARISLVPNPLFVLSDTGGPPARIYHRMVYDSHRRRTVLFGGLGSGATANQAYLNDTWEYDGTNWMQRFPATSPSPRTYFGLTYDRDRQRIVLFGGATNNVSLGNGHNGETWEYDGTNWLQRLSALSPPARVHPALFYDPVRKVTTLYGGDTTLTNPRQGDIWVWDGQQWTQKTVVGPRPLFGGLLGSPARPQMIWDELRGYAVMPPTVTHDNNPSFRVTWTWDGQRWMAREYPFTGFGLTPSQSGSGGGLVYDTYRKEVIYWGGDGTDQTSLWRWNGTGWRKDDIDERIGLRNDSASAYDSHRHAVVQFGGIYSGPELDLRGIRGWTYERILADAPVALRPVKILDDPSANALVLRVVAAGTPPLTYAWQRNGTTLREGFPYTGTTQPDLLVDRSLSADTGRYRCVIRGRCGEYTTPEMTLQGLEIPTQVLTAVAAPVAGVPGLKLTWEDSVAVLEYAPSPAGPWSKVPSAKSPYQAPLNGPAGFYRLRSP